MANLIPKLVFPGLKFLGGVTVGAVILDNIPTSGHSYNKKKKLGTSSLEASVIASRIFSYPSEYFPMPNKGSGSLNKVGDSAILLPIGGYEFPSLPLPSENPVKVVQATETSIKLQAEEGHFLQGTAEHYITKEGDDVYYNVKGENNLGESALRAGAAHIAALSWPLLAWWRTSPVLSENFPPSNTSKGKKE